MHLVQIIKYIQENDPNCIFVLNKQTKKCEIYDWIIENLDKYLVLIDMIQQNE